MGIIRILLTKFKTEKKYKIVTDFSIVLHIIVVLFLSLAREPYAVTVAFLLLIVKVILLFKVV